MVVGRLGASLARLASLAALVAFAAPASADPLAVLAAVKGRVQLVRPSGTSQVAGFGQSLERGDRIVVPAGGSATVFFHDGNVIELAEKSTITVGGKVTGSPRVGPAPELTAEVYGQVAKFVTGGSAQTGLVAMATVRGTNATTPILLAPRNTGILIGRPAFSWRPVESATRYRVAVRGDQGELWNREIAGIRLDYPADAESLAAGASYTWEIQALSDLGPLRKESTTVDILRAEDAAAVRADLARIRDSVGGAENPAAHFLSGSYLFGRGLYRDAAHHFEALARLSPEASAPHEALGKVYRDEGLMDLAAVEFEQALKLTREP